MECAKKVAKSGANVLRGGAFKLCSSPYAFQGLGREGLEILAEARKQTGLPVITEVMTVEDVPLVAEFADILQIGARNSQNFNLLHAAGRQPKPVLLKRGLSGTIEELLLSAERSEERRVGKECRSRCDWSSDVCSSDLFPEFQPSPRRRPATQTRPAQARPQRHDRGVASQRREIGRASCRERV